MRVLGTVGSLPGERALTHLVRCLNGHEWEAADDAPTLVGAKARGCPHCGAPERTLPPAATLSYGGQPPTAEAAAADQLPPTIAGYEILEELGRGGMGVVYKARRRSDARLAAIKVIRTERLSHPEAIRRFRREAQAAARLSHPNIVVVYESDQDGDTHFLVMEYVPGVTLQRLVEESGPLAVALACDFVRQAALGLQHAAEQGLVHRDVKPANLMAVPPGGSSGGRPLLKILDMGVARLYQLRHVAEESLATLTRDGAVIGTPDYVAPEQLENPHAADIRADLYSLGCTFYFLLTGKPPFPGGTLLQKLDRQRWETAPSVDQLRPDAPPGAAAVIRKLLAKRPGDRFQTPAELADALDEWTRTGALPPGHQPAPLREVRRFTGHDGPVAVAAFAPDGRSAISCGADRTLRMWDLETGEERRLAESPFEIGCLAAAPGRVLSGMGVGVRIWDLQTGKEAGRLTGHTDAVRAVAASADGRLALTGGDELWCGQGHKGPVTSVAFAADGIHLLSTGVDGTLRLWRLPE
jgi:serine/threonine protein kinase